MPDNLKNPGPEDGQRISLTEAHEVAYWCKELNVTRERLAELVALRGPSAAAVREELGLPTG